MRISDWSSDVCSADLTSPVENHPDSASGKQGTASSGRFTPRHPESARTLVHMGTGKRGYCESCGWILRLGEAGGARSERSEEHTSELQSLMRMSYAVFFLKKKKDITQPYT